MYTAKSHGKLPRRGFCDYHTIFRRKHRLPPLVMRSVPATPISPRRYHLHTDAHRSGFSSVGPVPFPLHSTASNALNCRLTPILTTYFTRKLSTQTPPFPPCDRNTTLLVGKVYPDSRYSLFTITTASRSSPLPRCLTSPRKPPPSSKQMVLRC